ncbi:hypothetical protein FQN52_004093 [Onygenales sp. PD_12]|nr:hypothetical protein FQN52_004093 [Onygenales sp. PD_12]
MMVGHSGLCGSLLLAGLCVHHALAQEGTYEAEDMTLNGVTVGTEVAGYSGTGYVEGFDNETDSIGLSLTSAAVQLYDLSIIYAGIYGDKAATLVVNGAGSQVSLPATEEFTTLSAGKVLLEKGENTIEIQSNWGWYLLDAITLTPSAPRPPHDITTTPVSPNATADAKALLAYLGSTYGSKIISGQQDLESLNWITENIGKTPAILGVDLMDYTDSRISRGASSTDIADGLTFSVDSGGLVTLCWHWGAPVGLYDTPEHPWYSGFYTDATDFNLTTALSSPDNANYTLLLHDIDTVAVQLKSLSDAGVPVLFRPLHEAEGGWFWWGAQGAEPAKRLYHLLFERLTGYHGLGNLVWVWNSIDPEWYPGDEVVDIVSADTYVQGHGAMSGEYERLLELVGDKKMAAASEVGSIPSVEALKGYEAHWAWWCTWSGDYVTGGEWNSKEFLEGVLGDEYVITLEEVQGWRGE